MCTTCGCGTDEVKIEGGNAGHGHGHEHVHADGTRHSHDHLHGHGLENGHGHPHDPADGHTHAAGEDATHSHAPGVSTTRMVQIEQDILAKNNAYAQREPPASGRARHLRAEPGFQPRLGQDHAAGARPSSDARRAAGRRHRRRPADQPTTPNASAPPARPPIQINTGKGCHLDAHMVGHAMAPAGPDGRLPADDRERRQPGLPGRLRSGRGAQGGHPVGHRRRGQAAQVPGHVPRGRA